MTTPMTLQEIGKALREEAASLARFDADWDPLARAVAQSAVHLDELANALNAARARLLPPILDLRIVRDMTENFADDPRP